MGKRKKANKPFKCGCDKAGPYSRANALYKHVENKHDGVYPEGSTAR